MGESYEGNKMSLSYDDAKKWMELCNAVRRLKDNPDFQLLFDVYTRHEVMRLSGLLVDISTTMSQSKEQLEENIILSLKASSMFRKYILQDVEMIRQIAVKTIEDYTENNK